MLNPPATRLLQRGLAALVIACGCTASAAGRAQTAANRAPVLLRYRFIPGKTFRYAMNDKIISVLQVEGKPAVTDFTQSDALSSIRKILSTQGETGVLEEKIVKGSRERVTASGMASTMASESVTRYTNSVLGEVLKVERIGPGGKANTSPQPFDGLSFALPVKAVAPGAKWTNRVTMTGVDGKPISLTAISTFTGISPHNGRPCAHVVTTFNGAFVRDAVRSEASPAKGVSGNVTGKVVYFLSTELGQDDETTAEIAYVVRTPGTDGVVTNTLKLTITQQMQK